MNNERTNRYIYISGGQLVKLPALTKSQFFPVMIGPHQYSHCRYAVDLEIDHSDAVYESCRIIAYERCQPWSAGSYLDKFDSDLNQLAAQAISGDCTCQYICVAINPYADDADGNFFVY